MALPESRAASVPNPEFAASSFAKVGIEGHWQVVDLVWLWFRNPHRTRPPRNQEWCGLL